MRTYEEFTAVLAAEAKEAAPRRINVAVDEATILALRLVIEREGVSLVEAVRRLTHYGDVVYRAVKEEGAEVLLKTGDTSRQVVLL